MPSGTLLPKPRNWHLTLWKRTHSEIEQPVSSSEVPGSRVIRDRSRLKALLRDRILKVTCDLDWDPGLRSEDRYQPWPALIS